MKNELQSSYLKSFLESESFYMCDKYIGKWLSGTGAKNYW